MCKENVIALFFRIPYASLPHRWWRNLDISIMISWPFVVWTASCWFRNSVYPNFNSPAELGEVVSLGWPDPFREILRSSNFHSPQPLLPKVVSGYIENNAVFGAPRVAKRERVQVSWPHNGLWLVSTRGLRVWLCVWLPSIEEWSAWSCPGGWWGTLEHYSSRLSSQHSQGPQEHCRPPLLTTCPLTLAGVSLRYAWVLELSPVWAAWMWVAPGWSVTWLDGSKSPASGSSPCRSRIVTVSGEKTQALSGYGWQSMGEGSCKEVYAQNSKWGCDKSPHPLHQLSPQPSKGPCPDTAAQRWCRKPHSSLAPPPAFLSFPDFLPWVPWGGEGDFVLHPLWHGYPYLMSSSHGSALSKRDNPPCPFKETLHSTPHLSVTSKII